MRLSYLRKAIHVMIMGPPGSGKGTVSSRIIRDFAIQHVASGDLLRREISRKTGFGLEAEKYIKEGNLVPDDIIVQLMLSQIKQIPLTINWLLDGFPRNVLQANQLIGKVNLNAVINLDVPFDTIQERLSGRWTHLSSGRVYNDGFNPPNVAGIDDITGEALVQRDDDKPETVKKRLQTYINETEPLLNFFKDRNLLQSYSGTKTDDMWPSIKQFVKYLIARDVERADN